MIDEIRELGIDIVGIELGSELSNRAYYLAGFNKNKYIQLSREYVNKLKQKYGNKNIIDRSRKYWRDNSFISSY